MLDLLETRFGAVRARPLYCSVDPDLYRPMHMEPLWDLGYLGTYSEDRQPTLDALLLAPARAWKGGRFVVAGPQYPSSIAWPSNVERTEHLPPPDHRAFYAAQRFALNVTRLDMARAGWSPSVRLFEAAACATPIVSDAWTGIESFLRPGAEIVIARTTREVVTILRDTPEVTRVAIGLRARRRVLLDHTAERRAETFEQWMREALEPKASRPGKRWRGTASEAT
jgi:spore maturation protein CgeB